MSIRARLTAAFVVVVLAPIAVGAALVLSRVPATLTTQVADRLVAGKAGVATALDELCGSARLAAELLGREVAAGTPQAAVADLAGRNLVGYAVVVDAAGRVVAEAGVPPAVPGGGAATPATLGECDAADGSVHPPAALGASVALRTATGASRGRAAVALPLDATIVRRLADASHAAITLVSAGQPVLTTLPHRDAVRVAAAATRALASDRPVSAGPWLVTAAHTLPGTPVVVVSDDRPGRGALALVVAAVLVGAVLVAAVVAWALARITTRPLVELADAAGRVASGDLDTRIEVRSRDDVGRLAAAFNDMTMRLRAHIRALEASRDELRRNLERLGETLAGTHDLDRMLTVILETAMATTHATGGAILLAASGRGDLYLRVGRGLEGRRVGADVRVPLGEGVTGRVAVRGEPLHGRTGTGRLELSADEPQADAVISVPLRSGGKVIGVLDLYDPEGGGEFSEGDLATIRSFANQATVAIDNVLLHQEAQRLSITDGLTGLWNYRYFQMGLGREIERSARFGRPVGLLMFDLDHFKAVNDTYGHQRGDAVLVELATRVKTVIREVDVLARYGGEEFVLLLPETGADGAAQLAERICDVVRSRPFGGEHGDEPPLPITVSVGAAVYPLHATDGAALVRAADEALYAAKESGRDAWRVAGSAAAPAGFREPADG